VWKQTEEEIILKNSRNCLLLMLIVTFASLLSLSADAVLSLLLNE
jgi:hypothetical protein